MATSPAATRTNDRTDRPNDRDHASHTPVTKSTETKAAFKTTELMAFVGMTIAVLIAAAVVDQSDAGGLGAKQAWLYVTILTVGYMISRGLAKSGSRDPYTDDNRKTPHHRRARDPAGPALLSAREIAAVDDELRPRDEARVVAREIGDGA